MKGFFTSNLGGGLMISLFLLIGCTNESLSPDEITDKFADGLPIRLSTSDYNGENTYYMLNDDEPSEVFFNTSERWFYTDQPLQLTVDDNLCFQLRFYSPRALPNVTVWAKIEGYDEEFKLFVFEKVMPFHQFRMELPFATRNVTAATRSGKLIEIMANPHLAKESITLTAESDAPYWKTLQAITCHWHIRFGRYNPNQTSWAYPLHACHAREGVAMALNMTYMYSSPEFAAELAGWGPLYSDNNKTEVNKETVLKQAIGHRGLVFGYTTGVMGLGGGETFGMHESVYFEQYPDDSSITETMFHEYAHCLGYGHAGNMTYEQTGPGWPSLCGKVYEELALAKKLPVYSRRFLHSRRSKTAYLPGGGYYRPSKHVIEDPELDEVDGGLARGNDFLDTDWGEIKDAPELSFRLDYNDAGVGERNYMPRSVYVYGNKMYVTNDIRAANFTWDVYDLSTGKPVHEKQFTQWTLPNGNTQNIGTPADIIRTHDKIYLAGSHNTLFVFDAETYECTATLGLGFDAVGLAATNGTLYAYRGIARAFPEHDLPHGSIASSSDLGAHSNNTMTADYAGNVYAVDYHSKRLVQLDTRYMMACKLTSGTELTFEAGPLGAAWSPDGRLFVSFDGKQTEQKFCEVDPKTGKIIKNLTTIGGITLQNPAKCLIRHNTLFIIDRVGGLCLYAIPLSQLN